MVTGSVTTSAILALIAAFLVQAVKQAIAEEYYRFIPLPLGAVMLGVGILLAFLSGNDMVAGAMEGIVAAALAAFGYDMVSGFVHSE